MSRTLPLESRLRLGMFESITAAAISSRYSASGTPSAPRVDASWFESGKEKGKTYKQLRQFASLPAKSPLSHVFSFSCSEREQIKVSQLRHGPAPPIYGRA